MMAAGKVYPERKEQAPCPRWRRGRRLRPAWVLARAVGGEHRIRLVWTEWCWREVWPTHRCISAARYYARGYVAAAPDLARALE